MSSPSLPYAARLAEHLTDGQLLEAASFGDDGSPRNAPARELQRRWNERAHNGYSPTVLGARLTFQPKETHV